METTKCPRGERILRAETRTGHGGLATKLHDHNYFFHHGPRANLNACREPAAPAPIQRSYRNTTARGVTS